MLGRFHKLSSEALHVWSRSSQVLATSSCPSVAGSAVPSVVASGVLAGYRQLSSLSDVPVNQRNTPNLASIPQHHATASSLQPVRQKTVVGNLGPTTRPDEHDVIKTEAGVISIEGYDAEGFFVNEVAVDSAIVCTGTIWMMWDVKTFEDITEHSLALPLLLRPPPELLIIGCGQRSQQLPGPLQKFLIDHQIPAEVLDTPNAISTFNILNQEGRQVTAAMLPAG